MKTCIGMQLDPESRKHRLCHFQSLPWTFVIPHPEFIGAVGPGAVMVVAGVVVAVVVAAVMEIDF